MNILDKTSLKDKIVFNTFKYPKKSKFSQLDLLDILYSSAYVQLFSREIFFSKRWKLSKRSF